MRILFKKHLRNKYNVVLVLSLFFLFSIFFQIFFKPIFLRYLELREDKKRLINLISHQQKKVDILRQTEKAFQILKDSLNLEKEHLSKNKIVLFLLKDLYQMASNHQLFFEKISPLRSAKILAEKDFSIEIHLLGSYSNLSLFLIELMEKKPFIYFSFISLESESLAAAKEKFLPMQLRMQLLLKNCLF